MENNIKLHLGCGEKVIDGFVNIDVFPYPGVTVGFAEKLDFDDNSVDLIYASHLLEHYPKDETVPVLEEWHRVLKLGGILRVAVPDFAKAVEDEGSVDFL